MTDKEVMQMALDLEKLADRFSEGWHAGIQIDASDVMLLLDSAEALRAALAQPEPEPAADKYLMEVECTKCGAKQDGILTVNAPQQRNWQRLTEQDFSAINQSCSTKLQAATSAESILKEKNT